MIHFLKNQLTKLKLLILPNSCANYLWKSSPEGGLNALHFLMLSIFFHYPRNSLQVSHLFFAVQFKHHNCAACSPFLIHIQSFFWKYHYNLTPYSLCWVSDSKIIRYVLQFVSKYEIIKRVIYLIAVRRINTITWRRKSHIFFKNDWRWFCSNSSHIVI